MIKRDSLLKVVRLYSRLIMWILRKKKLRKKRNKKVWLRFSLRKMFSYKLRVSFLMRVRNDCKRRFLMELQFRLKVWR